MTALKPNTKARWKQNTTSGGPVYGGNRSLAHLDYTVARLAQEHPDARLEVIQSAYHTGVAASAGTHDKDACYDVRLVGLSWGAAQRFLRECGWAAWHRTPAEGFTDHIHMVSLGYGTAPVGIFVPGQVADYYAHRTGLVGHVHDPSWFPPNIAALIFNYPAYVAAQEDDMAYLSWPEKDRKAFVADVVDGLRQEIFAGAGDGKHNFGFLFSRLYNKVMGAEK